MHVLRLRGRMEQEEEEVVMEFTDSELLGDVSGKLQRRGRSARATG